MELLEKKYQDRYTNDIVFQNEYIHHRAKVYRRISEILGDLGVKSSLDIGCSFGLLVEICNAKGIDAFGFDLPIDNLREFHEKLDYSKGKFIYGSIDDEAVLDTLRHKEVEAITILDSLRYFGRPELIENIGAKNLIIKEVSDNLYIRNQRKKMETIPDLRLYTPVSLLEMFKKYKPIRIYVSKFILHINHPSRQTLNLVNYLPTYTIVLQRFLT